MKPSIKPQNPPQAEPKTKGTGEFAAKGQTLCCSHPVGSGGSRSPRSPATDLKDSKDLKDLKDLKKDDRGQTLLRLLPQLTSLLVDWFAKAGRDLPWRRNREPYAVLVSELMLQQTQVATVIDYFHRWMLRFPDVQSLAEAPETDVLHAWQGLGYYSRARNLHKAAKQIVELHGGVVPRDLDALQNLPGLGRYTAGAVATFAYDLPVPIVDANIARVLARLQDSHVPVDSTAGLKALWDLAAAMQPGKGKKDGTASGAGLFNEALMELGALVCLPRQPKCGECPVKSICQAKNPELLPVKKPAAKTLQMQEHCAWIVQKGRILLELQPGPRWQGLWKLSLTGKQKTKPLLRMAYPFTNHRVTLCVYEAEVPGSLGENQKWFPWKELDQVAITAPHRRAILQLMAMGNPYQPRR